MTGFLFRHIQATASSRFVSAVENVSRGCRNSYPALRIEGVRIHRPVGGLF